MMERTLKSMMWRPVVLGVVACIGSCVFVGESRGQAEAGAAVRETVLRALRRGDSEEARRIVQSEGWTDDSPDRSGRTALVYACELGDAALARALIEAGADVAVGEEPDDMPLVVAVDAGNTDLVELLLEHGAGWRRTGRSDIEIYAHDDATRDLVQEAERTESILRWDPGPLDAALDRAWRRLYENGRDTRNRRIQHLLLTARKQPPVSPVARDLESDVREAVEGGDVARVVSLVRDGRLSGARAVAALAIARRAGRFEVVELLMQPAERYVGNELVAARLNSQLVEAIGKGLVEQVVGLCYRGADVNDSRGYSGGPLHVAAREGNGEIVEVLIAFGAEIDARDERGRTPLSVALSQNQMEVANLLIDRGAGLTAEDLDQALYAVSHGDNVALILDLLARGADPNVMSLRETMDLWSTPLINVSERGHVEAVRAMIERGADVNAMSGRGETAMMFAQVNLHDGVAQVLRNAGAAELPIRARWPFRQVIRSGDTERLSRMLARGADVNQPGSLGTPLEIAMNAKQYAVADFLLDRGASLVLPTRSGVVYEAVVASDESREANALIGRLIEMGSDVNERGGYERNTPLMCAAERRKPSVVRLLLEAGADVGARNGRGQTAETIAMSIGRYDIAQLISAHGGGSGRQREGGR